MGKIFLQSEAFLGNRYGRLIITKDLGMRGPYRMILCRCDCGMEKEFMLNNVTRKIKPTKSCGCTHHAHLTKHGLAKHPLYFVWKGMKQRCYYEKAVNWKDYGGRGIKICDEWRDDFNSFYSWAIDKWSKGLYLDRERNDGDYEPSNCRFVTRRTNNRNTRKNVWITYKGETKLATDWAIEIGIPISLMLKRIKKKWPLEKAMSNIMYSKTGKPLAK